MIEILGNLNSPAWWFTAVVVAIIINLASSYLKEPLDNSLSKVSSWWRFRSEKQKAKDESISNLYSQDEFAILVEFNRIIILTILAFTVLIGSITFLTFGVSGNPADTFRYIVSTIIILFICIFSTTIFFYVFYRFRLMYLAIDKRNARLAAKSNSSIPPKTKLPLGKSNE
ncbi:MAG: hypothetical protein HYZ25_14530 [Chloroflexi bacterium]|nr:hypothetical protein [Chloroflexota bacterium]